MRWQTRIKDIAHPGVRLEVLRNFQRRGILAFNARFEGFHASCNQVGRIGLEAGPVYFPEPECLFDQRFVATKQPAHCIGMTT